MSEFRLVIEKNRLMQIGPQIRTALEKVTGKVAEDIRTDIIDQFSMPKSGALVTRYNPTRQVQVSSPGEAPAIDIGNLKNSISVEHNPSALQSEVIVGAEYGIYLELGTVKMAARPFLGPAVENNRQSFEHAVGQAFRTVIE